VQIFEKNGGRHPRKQDGVLIKGPTPLHGCTIDSLGDHRIAMSFAIAGLIADEKTVIKNSECIDVSFPGFFEVLEKSVVR
jgi:3-phosphoshikimate 1-carboxyvinyltransferase